MLASLGGSTMVVLAVTAINGVLLMACRALTCRPRRRRCEARCSARWCCRLPLAARLPDDRAAPRRRSRLLLYLVPPVWFLGVEELLLGHGSPYLDRLAGIAAAAFVASLGGGGRQLRCSSIGGSTA